MEPAPENRPIVGQQLHEYDLEVCDYVAGNIRAHLGDADFAAEVEASLPPRLAHYLREGLRSDAAPDRLLLDDVELGALEAALMVSSPALDRFWEPYDPLHERHVYCVREVRDGLTRQDAEDWSRACSRFARRLDARRLLVFEGIGIVRDWVGQIRRLKKALGATRFLPHPDGSFPTPTTPTPLLLATPDPADDRASSGPAGAPQVVQREPPQDARGESTLGEVLATLHQVLELVSARSLVRDYYSTEQAATILGKAHWTVREWCRLGRVNADKRFSGRGRSPEWVLSHAELQRIQREGLLPRPKHWEVVKNSPPTRI